MALWVILHNWTRSWSTPLWRTVYSFCRLVIPCLCPKLTFCSDHTKCSVQPQFCTIISLGVWELISGRHTAGVFQLRADCSDSIHDTRIFYLTPHNRGLLHQTQRKGTSRPIKYGPGSRKIYMITMVTVWLECNWFCCSLILLWLSH
jgi:hypothetical protein